MSDAGFRMRSEVQNTPAYSEVLTVASGYRHVIVSGPQRSGTRIAAHMLAHDLGRAYVDESQIGLRSLRKLFACLVSEEATVMQAPAVSAGLHWIDHDDTLVVFMRRDVEAIQQSQDRIGWTRTNQPRELRGYFRKPDGMASSRCFARISPGNCADTSGKRWGDHPSP